MKLQSMFQRVMGWFGAKGKKEAPVSGKRSSLTLEALEKREVLTTGWYGSGFLYPIHTPTLASSFNYPSYSLSPSSYGNNYFLPGYGSNQARPYGVNNSLFMPSIYGGGYSQRYNTPYVTNWGGYGQNSLVSFPTLQSWSPGNSLSPVKWASQYETFDPRSLRA